MKNKIYGYPILPKAGLGNMLLVWADCYISCKDLKIKQIAPFWRKLRIGTYLRGERDKREYQRLFTNGKNISGINRLLLLLISNKVSTEDFKKTKFKNKLSLLPKVVTFSSMNNFNRLTGRHNEVLKEVYNITKPKYWPINLPKSFIAIHIRRGDFPEMSNEINQIYFKIPIEWYIDALNQIRNQIGNDFPVVIFSDGTDEEVKPILSLPKVIRSSYPESISDMLAISKAIVIITSKSTYSLFGAFLGQVPSLWYIGKNDIYKSSYMPAEQNSSLEIEWMPNQILPDDFMNTIKKRIQNPK